MQTYPSVNYKKFVNVAPGVLIILCRHGSTKANDSKNPLVRGWDDFELDEKGKIEAQLLGNRLKEYGIKKIFSSDFQRDIQTAQIVANIIGITDIEVDYDLRTWDVGQFSGDPLKDVNPVIEEIYKHPWMKPPGSNESFNDFSERFIGSFEKKINMASIDIYRPSLIVTHGKNIAMAQTYIEGGNSWDAKMPEPAKMAVVKVNADRSLAIEMDEPTENVIEDV